MRSFNLKNCIRDARDRPLVAKNLGISARRLDQHKVGKETWSHFGEVAFLLADLRLPLFDQDIEDADGIPAEV